MTNAIQHTGTATAGGRTLSKADPKDVWGTSYMPEGEDYTDSAIAMGIVGKSLIRYINRTYPKGDWNPSPSVNYKLGALRVTEQPNEYGHKIFALVTYSDTGAGALVAGKAVTGGRILWTTYMD